MMANVTAPAPGSISSPPTDPTLDVSLISTSSSSSSPPTAITPSPPEPSLTPPSVSSPPPEPSASPPPPEPSASPPPPPEPSASPPPPPEPSASPPPPPEPSASPPPPPSEPSESPPPPHKQSKSPPPDQPSPPPPTNSVSPSPPEDDQGASPGPPSPSTIPVTPSPPQPTNSAFSEQTPPPSSPVTSLPSPSPPLSASNNKSPSSDSSRSSQPNGSSENGPSASNSENSVLIIALTFTCIIILAMAIIGAICCLRRKKRNPYPNTTAHAGGNYNGVNTMGTPPAPSSHLDSANGYSSDFSGGAQYTPVPMSPNMTLGVNKFTYEELAAATGGFSQGNVIGQGGFGFVHKGILPNGKEVAVKSLKAGSGQGEREFQAEVDIISRVHHRHLVSLVGYCIDGGQRILVYEFVPNKTLEYHLHGTSGQASMSWGTRMKIALGSAKGLAYLHEDCHPRIIHRDIKTANILIDYNFEAMVADFGLAKLSADNNTHVSTRVMGTFGYLAPEYASSGKLTEKSDVFSFGVMLLELITGRRPLDQTGQIMEDTLVDWARPLLGKAHETGNYNEVADPLMEGNYNHNEMSHMVACASASISHSARRRPKMSQIVRSLEGDLSIEALNDSKPGQGDSSAYDTGAYNADMTKFRQMVMLSQDFNSSEYGESDTSEYRLNTSQKNSSDS